MQLNISLQEDSVWPTVGAVTGTGDAAANTPVCIALCCIWPGKTLAKLRCWRPRGMTGIVRGVQTRLKANAHELINLLGQPSTQLRLLPPFWL